MFYAITDVYSLPSHHSLSNCNTVYKVQLKKGTCKKTTFTAYVYRIFSIYEYHR